MNDILNHEGFTQDMASKSLEELKSRFKNSTVRYSPAPPDGEIPAVKIIINTTRTVAVAWAREHDQLPFKRPVGYYLADNATTDDVRGVLSFIGCQDYGIGVSVLFQEFELPHYDRLHSPSNRFVPDYIGEIWVGGRRTYPFNKHDAQYIHGSKAAIAAGKIKAI